MMITLGVALLAAVVGGIYRRWWGSPQPSWYRHKDGTDRDGWRAIQVAVGVSTFFLLNGFDYVALIFAVTAAILLSLSPWTTWGFWWNLWRKLDGWTPNLGRWFTGWSTYAEASQGAIVWTTLSLVCDILPQWKIVL